MTIQAKVIQSGPSLSVGQVREHAVHIDRPVGKGGSDMGMMGGELLLVALGGCFMSNLLAVIQSRAANISQVELYIEGTLSQAPSRYSHIVLKVSAQHQDRDLLLKAVEMADRACIVANTLRSAVELEVGVL